MLGGTLEFERSVRQREGEEGRGGTRSSELLSCEDLRAAMELSPLLHHLGLPSDTWQPAWLISIFTAKGQLTGCSLQIFKLLD